jgi:hypothetical protein
LTRGARSLTSIANEKVSFLKALEWAGAPAGRRDRGLKVTCPLCGASAGMRVYPDHGYCFSQRLWVTPVRLLADYWNMEREDAADKALDLIGYVAPDYSSRFAETAAAVQEPARSDLADALRIWCSANCPDWQARQFEPRTARALAGCNALLPQVRSASDCDAWLAGCKRIMGKALNVPLPK